MHDRGHKRKSIVHHEQQEQRRVNIRSKYEESDSSASSLEQEALENFSITSHAAVVFQARELVKALMRSHSSSQHKAGKLSRSTRNRLQEYAKDEMLERHLSRGELVKTRSLVKELEIMMEVPGLGSEAHTASGRVAVSKLKAAIFGGAKTDRGLLDIVVVCTVEKARLFHSELVSLAKRCISSSNCFGMLALAHRLSLPELEAPAILFCVANFAAAMRQAPTQLASLSVHSLVQVLQSSCLDVASESDVIDAVLLWLEDDPERRCEHLYDLLQGVRLEELGLLELGRLQQNPMIEENSSASALIASVYNQRMMNNITRSRQMDWPAQKRLGPTLASAVQAPSLTTQLAARIAAAGPLPPHPKSHHPAYITHPSSHPRSRRSSEEAHGSHAAALGIDYAAAGAGLQGGQDDPQQQIHKLQRSLPALTPLQVSQQQQQQQQRQIFTAHGLQSSSRGLGLGPELSAASLATLAGGGSEMFSSSRQSVEQLQQYLYADRQQAASTQQQERQQQQQTSHANLTSQQELSSSLPLPTHSFPHSYHHMPPGSSQPAFNLSQGATHSSSMPSQQQQQQQPTHGSASPPLLQPHQSQGCSMPMTLMLGTSAVSGAASVGGAEGRPFIWPHNSGTHSSSNTFPTLSFASSGGEGGEHSNGGFASPFVSVTHGLTAFPQLSFALPGNPHPTQSSPFASPFFALPGYNNSNHNSHNRSSSPTDTLPPLPLPLPLLSGPVASLTSLQQSQQLPPLHRELSLSMPSLAAFTLPPIPILSHQQQQHQQQSLSFNVAQGTQQQQQPSSSSLNLHQGGSAPGGAAGLLQAIGLGPAPIRLSLSSPPKQKDPLRTAAFLGLLST